MRKISYNFLFVFGLMAILVGIGAFSAKTNKVSASSNDVITKIPKNMSVISVTTDEPMTVFVDGVEVGRTQGNQIKFEKTVTPGIHEVRIVGPEGKEFVKTYTFNKGVRNCVCLKTVTTTSEKECPYYVVVNGPEKVNEGDLITFAVIDQKNSGLPFNYVWKVSPSNARITSGLGTSSITVDTTGLGNQTIEAEVNVGDGTYDKECGQRPVIRTIVEKIPPPPTPTPFKFDEWDARAFDDDKARFDNLAIELQNRPDAQGYIIMYQGTDKKSMRSYQVEKLSKRALDYLVRTRLVAPNRLQFTNWGSRPFTRYEIWIVPPGANPPVPQQ